MRELEPDNSSPPSGVNVCSPFEFKHLPTPHSPYEHFDEDWGVDYNSDHILSFSNEELPTSVCMLPSCSCCRSIRITYHRPLLTLMYILYTYISMTHYKSFS
jgi:hypothetical protein